MNSNNLEVIKYVPQGIERAYSATVAKVPFIVDGLVGAIRDNNERGEYKPDDPSFVLDCLFVPHYLEDLKRAKYADYDEDIRDEVMKIAVKKIPSPLLEAVAEARRQIAGLAVSTDEGVRGVNVTREDIVCKDGKFTVSPSHKRKFIEAVTVFLDEDEMELYKLMFDAVPRLRSFRDKGFNIDRLMQTYVNRYGGLSGEPTFEDLLRDVHRFRFLTPEQRALMESARAKKEAEASARIAEEAERQREQERKEGAERARNQSVWEREILAEKARRQDENNRKTM